MKNVEYGIMWPMNQLLTPGIALVLSESLSLYWRILKAKWPSLLIVAAFSQLILTAIRLALQRCCEIGGMDALPTDVLASILVFQTSGLVAVVIAVDYAARLLSGGRSPESGGIAAAYGVPSTQSAESVTILESPSFTPGSGISSEIGRKRSRSPSASASAVRIAVRVSFLTVTAPS